VYKKENYILTKESQTLPKYTIFINLEKLEKDAIFVKVSNDAIEVNGIVFTNSEIEFQGLGLFTSKETVLLSFDEMSKIKDIILLNIDEAENDIINKGTKEANKEENKNS
jgi:hypothetical protein